jgi:hypothetical protein
METGRIRVLGCTPNLLINSWEGCWIAFPQRILPLIAEYAYPVLEQEMYSVPPNTRILPLSTNKEGRPLCI